MSCNILVRHPEPRYPVQSTPLPSLSIDPLPIKQVSQMTTQPPPSALPSTTTQRDFTVQTHTHPSNEKVKAARRYRLRLQTRLRRLIVPELPNKPVVQALESPLDTSAIDQPVVKPKNRYTHSKPAPYGPQASGDQPLGVDSQAFALAEEIAERDVPAQGSLAQPNADPPSTSMMSTAVLLGGTVAAIGLVCILGLWAARTNQVSPKNQQQAAPPNNQASTPKASAEARKRDQQRKLDLNDISAALEVYKRQVGTYPAGNDISVVYALQYTSPPYISYVNYDPLSDDNTKIKYSYSSDGSSFTIAARLEDSTDEESQNGYYIVRSK